MVISYVILLFIILWGMHWKTQDANREYLSMQQTKSIQGIFVILVLFSHFSSYINVDDVNMLDRLFIDLNAKIGQLMVVVFLFYSGYGIMEKIKSNKSHYMNNFLKCRFFPVYIKFVVCVFLFVFLDVCLGRIKQYTFGEIVLAFVGWTNVGNSNWFMFATFVLYILIFMFFKVLNIGTLKNSLIFFTFSVVAYVALFSLIIQRGSWWYNTIMCFPFGMWFSFYVDNIDKYICKNVYKLTIVSFFIFGVSYVIQDRVPYGYCLFALAFNALLVLATVKVRIGNKILDFWGKHVFSIYILQRIAYILLEKAKMPVYLFFILSVSITLILAVLFDYYFKKAYKIIVNRKNIEFGQSKRE